MYKDKSQSSRFFWIELEWQYYYERQLIMKIGSVTQSVKEENDNSQCSGSSLGWDGL